jgi:hypothetical protein
LRIATDHHPPTTDGDIPTLHRLPYPASLPTKPMSEMLPQPPPDAPAPPPGAAVRRSMIWRNWIWGAGIVSILVVCSFLWFVSQLGRRGRGHDQVEAVSNARQIGLALFEFEMVYGSFPGYSTVGMVQKDFPANSIPMGTSSSNDFFRQIIGAEIATSESMFYSRTPNGRKPDNVFKGGQALEKGETGFAYITGLSSRNLPVTPLVVSPLIPGKRLFDYKFAKKHFSGKAVILRIDNSVTSLPIDKSGRVFIGGKDLFDPTQPFWGGKVPDVKWPE